MATKKQKRQILEAKRALEAEETRLSGLKALEKDRAIRARKAAATKAAAAKKEAEMEAALQAVRAEEHKTGIKTAMAAMAGRS